MKTMKKQRHDSGYLGEEFEPTTIFVYGIHKEATKGYDDAWNEAEAYEAEAYEAEKERIMKNNAISINAMDRAIDFYTTKEGTEKYLLLSRFEKYWESFVEWARGVDLGNYEATDGYVLFVAGRSKRKILRVLVENKYNAKIEWFSYSNRNPIACLKDTPFNRSIYEEMVKLADRAEEGGLKDLEREKQEVEPIKANRKTIKRV